MLKPISEISYRPLSLNREFKVRLVDSACLVKTSSDEWMEVKFDIKEYGLTLSDLITNVADASHHLLVAIECLLGHAPDLHQVILKNVGMLSAPFCLLGATFNRSEFFQLPTLWHHRTEYLIRPERWAQSKGCSHPERPIPHRGEVYRRYVPELSATISFRLIDVERDLEVFHEWHNQERVAHFWELNKPKDELKAYLEKGLMDPHQIPMMVEINGSPLGYYEMYWVREDRLGPYYESEPFDRGFHFLIGNTNFLGQQTTDQVIKCGLHFLFLDDPRTRRVMAEPRHDNQKVLKYAVASVGWRKVKLFDFPHKRAWLLENARELFFGGNAL